MVHFLLVIIFLRSKGKATDSFMLYVKVNTKKKSEGHFKLYDNPLWTKIQPD